MNVNSSRLAACAAAVISLQIVAGCDLQRGFSGRDEEWGRLRNGPFSVVNASHERTVVSANNRQVAIEAAEGFCLVKGSIEMSGRSAFAMIGDCAVDGPATSRQSGADELLLPPGVPGVITVSISGDPGFSGSRSAGSLDDLEAYLRTSDGRALLGRTGVNDTVKIWQSRQIGEALYVLVEDQNEAAVPILAPQFWRAFLDLNDRFTVVTISGFRGRPMESDEMLKYLVTQVQTLAAANRVPLDEPIAVVAQASVEAPVTGANVRAISDLEPESVVVTTVKAEPSDLWPTPRRRPSRDQKPPNVVEGSRIDPAARSADAMDGATQFAPASAPRAPLRPARG